MDNNIVYISINNWFMGRDYPPIENLDKWLADDVFLDNDWVKENKLCIYFTWLDMSQNFTISAPKEWVEKYCPELLTDEDYIYDGEKMKYSDFVFYPKEGETMPSKDDWDIPFREYCEENFGVEEYLYY